MIQGDVACDFTPVLWVALRPLLSWDNRGRLVAASDLGKETLWALTDAAGAGLSGRPFPVADLALFWSSSSRTSTSSSDSDRGGGDNGDEGIDVPFRATVRPLILSTSRDPPLAVTF
jgi:hypothetical protein